MCVQHEFGLQSHCAEVYHTYKHKFNSIEEFLKLSLYNRISTAAYSSHFNDSGCCGGSEEAAVSSAPVDSAVPNVRPLEEPLPSSSL